MKFTFKCESDGTSIENSHPTVIHEIEAVTLPDVIENFELFLRGVGFSPEGVKEILNT